MQITTQPARQENILDLFLTNNSTLVNVVSCYLGLVDHDMVIAKCSTKPVVHELKPRKGHLFRKADWSQFKMLMKDCKHEFLSRHKGKTVDEHWTKLTSYLDKFTEQCVPSKLIKSKQSLPWITQAIRRLIRKRDQLYRKLKKSGDQLTRTKFIEHIKSKIK